MRNKILGFAFLCLLLPSFVLAQGMPNPGQAGLNAAMTKLFGDAKAFTSKANIRVLENNAEKMTMVMDYAMLDGKIRADLDLGQMKSKEMTAESAGSLKQMGMDKMSTIIDPARKVSLVMYPTLKAYTEMPMGKEENADNYKIIESKVGTETVDGHPTTKYKVTISGEKEKHEGFVWKASDLKDFPIQMQMNDKANSVVMLFRDIKLAKPDAALFQPPAGFTRHASMEALMQQVMLKMFQK